MSMNKNYFVIIGYDLTKYKADKYEDWKWTDEGEEYICNQCQGHIQLFDDPMSSERLYLGYVLAHGDEYYFETAMLKVSDILDMVVGMQVKEKLHELIEIGVVRSGVNPEDYRVIIFEECC